MRNTILFSTLIAGFVLSCVLFMTLGARGNWDFILAFRGGKLLTMMTIAIAIGQSTIIFQTLSGNRILTPSIMGFDALYLMIQSVLVLTIGGLAYASLGSFVKFAAETLVMTGAALILFRAVLRDASDISRMILTGLILGVLFRSLTSMVNRIIDPNEFSIIQQVSFAQFNAMNQDLTFIALFITLACSLWLWTRHRELDVIALGRDHAINLGIDHDRSTRQLLIVVALLVSVSTALVGPIVFFGLLVSAVTYQIAGTWRHAVLIPVAALLSAIILIFSQTIFERVLHLSASVSVVIEGLGGLVFLYLILKRRRT